MDFTNLVNSLTPSVEVWTSMVAGMSITGFLLLFSHRPFKLPLVLPRYITSIGCGLIVWFLLLGINQSLSFSKHISEWLELVSGGFVFITAVFCNYYLGNIGGGFRLEMLVNLAEANEDLTVDEWMALYGDGNGMHCFLDDRLRATLIPWKLAVWKGSQIILTPWGHFIGKVNRLLAALFSENQ